MKKAGLILIILSLVASIGCDRFKTRRDVHIRSYALNVEAQATLGSPFITSEYNTYGRSFQKRGLAEEQGFWKSYEYATSDSFIEKLVYSGRTGDIIRVEYKRYKIGADSPDYSEELSFDIGSMDMINFKQYRIKVINATDQYIRFQVLDD